MVAFNVRRGLRQRVRQFGEFSERDRTQFRDTVEVQNKYAADRRRVQLISYTVATLPSATNVGQIIYVSDETGGAVIAFSDGTNWRRVTDRAIVA
jgi:hypothetical protein